MLKQSARLAFSIEFWKNLQESCRFIYINYEILSNYKKKKKELKLFFNFEKIIPFFKDDRKISIEKISHSFFLASQRSNPIRRATGFFGNNVK